MKAGKYTIKELFVNRYLDQLVIPEIQRDYVWGPEQVIGLLNSVFADFTEFLVGKPPALKIDESDIQDLLLKNDWEDFYKKRKYSSNIGFIYAYSDPQYDKRYFLIDGQQRITSIYLVLLVLASKNGKSTDFKKYFSTQESLKLNYKIRDAASSFLNKLATLYFESPDPEVEDQSWYLNSYKNDTTIVNMIENLKTIRNWLVEKNLDEATFYDYLCNFTELWYFDTNISSQGENLYIYLNARGEHVQGNENIKAEMLSSLASKEKNIWGMAWENWQDFFWQRRKDSKKPNANADAGFNEFLSCITGLIFLLTNGEDGYKNYDSKKEKPSTASQLDKLNLDVVASYVNVLIFIKNNLQTFADLYAYSDWANMFWQDLWSILNSEENYWIMNYVDDLHSKERNRMVFVWGVLHWVNEARSDKDLLTIFRGIRQFYLRYKNNNRAVVGEQGITASVNRLMKTGYISEELEKEESIKEHWLAAFANEERRKFESVIWEIEDHPYNMDGSDVGMTNISHLVCFKAIPNLEYLSSIKSAFFKCFPLEEAKRSLVANYPVVQSILLQYGQFYRRKSPHYYENYHFSEWKRNVRSLDITHGQRSFSDFLDEFIVSNLSVEEFLAKIRGNTEFDSDTNNLLEQLRWYNFKLKEAMWLSGGNIAINSRHTEYDNDKTFENRAPFWTTNGEFRSNYRELFSLLP